MHICSGCGNEFEGNFCPVCGKRREDICPLCGAQINAGDKFCPHCGADLSAAPAPQKVENKPSVNVGPVKKVLNIFIPSLLIAAVIICFAVFAAPVAKDAFIGESMGSIYGMFFPKSDRFISVWPQQVVNTASVLVFFTALCFICALAVVCLQFVKNLSSDKRILGANFTVADLITAVALVLLIVVFAMSRVLWAQISKSDGGLGLIKEGGCTIAVSVITAIFFFLIAAAEAVKAVLNKRYPDGLSSVAVPKGKRMLFVMLLISMLYGILLFFIFLFPAAYLQPAEANAGSLYKYSFAFYMGANFYFDESAQALETMQVAQSLIGTLVVLLSFAYIIYALMYFTNDKIKNKEKNMERISHRTLMQTVLAIIFSVLCFISLPEGYAPGIGPVLLIVVSAAEFIIQTVLLALYRKASPKGGNQQLYNV